MAQTSSEPFHQHRRCGDVQRGVQLTVAMLGVGIVLGVDTAGALPSGAGSRDEVGIRDKPASSLVKPKPVDRREIYHALS